MQNAFLGVLWGAILLLASGGTAPVQAQTAPTAWPVYAQNAQNTGRAVTGTADASWEVPGDVAGFVAASDGTLYAKEYGDGTFIVPIDPGSSNRGTSITVTAAAGGTDSFRPVIGDGGLLYVVAPSGDGTSDLFRVDPAAGTSELFFNPENTISGTPAVGAEGIYVPTADGRLHVLDTNGTSVNAVELDSSVGTPTVGSNGMVYVGTAGGTLYAMAPDGSSVRTLASSGGSFAPIPAQAGETLFATKVTTGQEETGAPELYAIDLTTESVLWSYAFPSGSPTPPAIGPKGQAFVGFADRTVSPAVGTVYAFEAGSNIPVWTEPLIGAGGMPAVFDRQVYVPYGTTDTGGVEVFSIEGGPSEWNQTGGAFPVVAPPILLRDRTAVVRDEGGNLFAMRGPIANPSPTSISFADTETLNSSRTLTETLTNSGDADLSYKGASISGADAGDFTISSEPTVGTLVRPTGSYDVNVTFDPDANPANTTQTRTATLTLRTNAGPVDIPLDGVALSPSGSLSKSTIDFGQVDVNTTATGQVLFDNTGDGAMQITGTSLRGNDPGLFAVTSGGGAETLDPGSQKQLNVEYTPDARASHSAILDINTQELGTFSVALTGSGVISEITASSNTLDFGVTEPSTTAGPLTVDFTNSGDTDISVSDVSITGTNASAFSITAGGGTGQLSASETRSVDVTFTPATMGTKTATLTFSTDIGDYPVDLTGTGGTFALSASPNPASFGEVEVGASAQQDIAITNSGTETLTGVTASLSGTSDVTIAGDTGQTTLEAGATRTVTLDFSPTSSGSQSVTLDVAATEAASVSIPVSGIGITYGLSANPTSVDFGGLRVGSTVSQTIDLENTGTADLTLGSASLSGTDATDFALSTGVTGNVLQPGEIVTVTVDYTPSARGTDNATLDVSTENDVASASASLSGSGLAPVLSAPTSLSTGTVAVGQTEQATLTVENTGDANLTVSNVTLGGTNSGDFSVASLPGSAISPGETGDIVLDVTPSATGTRTAVATVESDGGTANVALSGTGATYGLSAIPNPLDFGSVLVGATASQTVTVENTSTVTVDLSAPALNGTDAANFAIASGGSGVSLAPGGTHTVTVEYAPSSRAANAASLDLALAGGQASTSVDLAGTGIAPVLSVPTSQDFGTVDVGQTTQAVIAVENTGDADLTLSGASLSGTNVDAFTVVSGGSGTIAPGGTQDITVEFAPSTTGSLAADLTISSDGGTGTVALSGTGATYSLSASPNPLDFGGVAVGGAVQSDVTLTNTGTVGLTLSSISVGGTNAGDVTIVGGGTTGILGAGATQTITLEFAPSASGTRTATLDISTDLGLTSLSVPLSGNGLLAGIGLSASTLDYGTIQSGTTAQQSVTVENTGDADLTISSTTLGGATPGAFAVVSGGSGTIAPGGTQEVTVEFAPSSGGAKSAQMTLATSLGDQTVDLTGFAATYGLSVSPAPVDFGSVPVGQTASQDLTVTNTSNVDVTLGSPAVSGTNASDYTIAAGGTTTTLTPGGTQTITVDFTPGASGTRTAALDLQTQNGLASASASLTGLGATYVLSATPSPLDFGSVDVGSTVQSDVTLSNDGNSSIILNGLSIGGTNAGDVTIVSGGGSGSLAVGDTRVVTLEFAPSTGGARDATLNVATELGIADLSVPLTGDGLIPNISLTPTTLDYGTIQSGTTAQLAVTVENTGTGDLTLSGTSLAGTTPGAFAVVSGGSGTIAPGGTQEVTVEFAPPSGGAKSAQMTLATSLGDQTVDLTGFAATYGLSVSPAPVDFGSVPVGQAASQDLTVTNTSNVDVTLGSPAVSGTNASDFTIAAGGTTTTLTPGGTQTITVDFTPGASGTRTAALDLQTQTGLASASASLTGTGVEPQVALSASSLDFGTVTVGATTQQTVTVENTGDADLTLSGATVSGAAPNAYQVSGATGTVAPGGSQDVAVTFAPSSGGSLTADLALSTNAGTATVALSGFGATYALTATPSPVDFGTLKVGTSTDQTVTLENTGNAPVTYSNVRLAGTNPGSFATTTPSGTLSPGQTADVTLTYAPADASAHDALLRVDTDNAGTVEVSVSGTGGAPVLSVTPASVDFGSVTVGQSATASVTLENTGSVDLVVASVALSTGSAFSIANDTGEATLAPGATRTVDVTFAPSAGGAASATLSIDTDGGTGSVALSGTGQAPQPTLTPSSVAFGPLAVNTEATRTVTLTNDGTASLEVQGASTTGANAGAFALQNASLPLTLEPGASTDLTVVFAPSTGGTLSASLDLSTNAGLVTASLSGTAVSISVNIGTARLQEPLDVSVELQGYTPSGRTLFYRPGGATEYRQLALSAGSSPDTFTATIPAEDLTLRGLDYVLVLSDGGTSVTFPRATEKASRTNPAHLQVQFEEVSAEGPFPANEHRMISIPAAADDSTARALLRDDYGPADPTVWRVVQWNAEAQAYREATDAALTPGTAAWLITTDGTPFTVGPGRTADASGPVSQTLQPGWNQIAVPFGFPVRWADVQGTEALEAPVGYAEGSYRFDVRVLQPWRGYFVYNPTDAPVSITLPNRAADATIAGLSAKVSTSPSKAAGIDSIGTASYTLQVSATLQPAGLRDVHNYLSLHPNASADRDPMDVTEPPAVGEHVRVSVVERGERLAGSFRPTGADGQRWDLEVAASVDESFDTRKSVTLHLHDHGTRPDGFQRYVLDLDRDRFVPIENGSFKLNLSGDRETRSIRVIVGSESFAKANSSGIPLRTFETALRTNYPNPFTDATTIRYTLSERRTVTLEVYNILGQRVRRLKKTTQGAGEHTVTWNGRTDYGDRAASGVYFVRMTAGNEAMTQKMTLIR